MSDKQVLANVVVEEVDSLTYGELIAIHASAEALNVEGPYVFMVYDGSLYIGEYDDDNLRIYHVISASKIDMDAIKLSFDIFKHSKDKKGTTI